MNFFSFFRYRREQALEQLNDGIACYNCMDFDSAWELLNKAAKYPVCSRDAYFYLQRLCFDLGDLENLTLYQSKMAYCDGIAYLSERKYKEAASAFRKAAAILPSAKIFHLLAVIYLKQNDHKTALYYYKKAIRRNPLYLYSLRTMIKVFFVKDKS